MTASPRFVAASFVLAGVVFLVWFGSVFFVEVPLIVSQAGVAFASILPPLATGLYLWSASRKLLTAVVLGFPATVLLLWLVRDSSAASAYPPNQGAMMVEGLLMLALVPLCWGATIAGLIVYHKAGRSHDSASE